MTAMLIIALVLVGLYGFIRWLIELANAIQEWGNSR